MTAVSNEPTRESRPIRVIFVVDSIYWVVNTFCHQIKKDNPRLEASICSQFAMRKALKRFGGFAPAFDVIHFLRKKPKNLFEGKFPVVTTLLHIDSGTELGPLYESDAVMTISTQWYNHLISMGIPSHKLGVVPFGVDSKVFYPPKREQRFSIRHSLNISEEAFVIGFSARRTSDADGRKGISCFVQALRFVHQRLPNVATVIIGPGWQQLATELRKEGIHCTLLPYQIDHEQIAKYYGAMDIFWVTARIEGGPVPLLEAMASGLSCISTPVGAALDLIENQKNGFLIPFNSPDQLADFSCQLAENPGLRNRIGRKARNTILRERPWSQSQQKLDELYELAIKNFDSVPLQEITPNQKSYSIKEIGTTSSSPQRVELDFSSPKLQKWLGACEHLNGLKMVLELREWRAALHIGFRALKASPFDRYVWFELIKIFLTEIRK